MGWPRASPYPIDSGNLLNNQLILGTVLTVGYVYYIDSLVKMAEIQRVVQRTVWFRFKFYNSGNICY